MATTRFYSDETAVTQATPNKQNIEDVFFATKEDVGKLILRVTIGVLMLFHGINKLFYGTEQVADILVSVGLPSFFSFGVLIGEVIAPLMLIVGYKVRIAASLVAFDMLMAVFLVHSAQILQLNPGGGWMLELNALYFLGAIAVLLLGSGRYGITHGVGPLD